MRALTMRDLRKHIRVGIAYLKAWNEGQGFITWDHLMEDLAAFEISRVQVRQWVRRGTCLDDGTVVTRHLIADACSQEMERLELSLFEDAIHPGNGWLKRELALFRHAAELAEAVFTGAELKALLSASPASAGDAPTRPPRTTRAA